jgi:hypothetical protein
LKAKSLEAGLWTAAAVTAQKVTLAVIAPGSVMGHDESERYLEELRKNEVQIVVAGGSQLSHVIQALIDFALTKRPELVR